MEKSDKYRQINEKLINVCDAKEKKIMNKSFFISGLSMIKLRDILVEIGKIHAEDIQNGTYVAVIPGGFAKKNYAVTVFELSETEIKIAAYADEGIINQHTSEGVINEFTKRIEQYVRDN